MAASSVLTPLIESRRVILCVGCGGVGKTTTTAALGLAAARRGKRVLCLTIDPARRLSQSLGLTEMTIEEQRIDRELLRKVGVPDEGSLTVMRLDTKTTFDDLITNLAPDERRREDIMNNVLYRYISTSLAGTQEYMAMEKLYAVKGDPRFDLIVLDTPPTANALEFLDAPERLVGAIDGDAIRWFVQAMEGSGKLSFNLLARSTAAILRGIGKVTGAGFLEQVAGFLVDINAIFGGWRQRAQAVAGALRGPDVAYVLVTTPDPLSVREVLYFADRLKSLDMRRDAVVVNRVHPSYGEPPSVASVEAAARGRSLALEHGAPERLLRALGDEARQAKLDGLHLLALEAAEDELSLRADVPAFPGDVHDLASLGAIADLLAPAASVAPS